MSDVRHIVDSVQVLIAIRIVQVHALSTDHVNGFIEEQRHIGANNSSARFKNPLCIHSSCMQEL